MTVAQLIDELRRYPDDYEVQFEDCDGEVSEVGEVRLAEGSSGHGLAVQLW